MNKKAIAATLLAGMMMFAGCSNSSGSTPSSQTPASETPAASSSAPAESDNSASVTIKVAGSTSVAPLMKVLKEAYPGNHVIEIQETGSSAGITATIEGAADLGMSSRDLKDAEKEEGLVDVAIALDGIAIIVHKDNPVNDLTTEQIAAIYTGEISNWSELGGEAGEIIVISREEGSGTRGAFEELLELEEVSSDALFENSTGAVKTNVSSSKNAIGYISLGTLDDTVAAVSVGGVECSVDNVKNNSYVIARPFLVCTMGEPSAAVQDLLDFILSEEGQAIVMDENYITVL